MTDGTTALVPWPTAEPVSISADAAPAEVVQRAEQLHQRDQKAVVSAMRFGAYEMAATFVWTRAMTSLKKQLAALGMEFVGEMLGRFDLSDDSNPITDIRDDEALELAEQLGLITGTEAMRLHQSHTLVVHFSDPDISQTEQMLRSEAELLLRNCVANFLSSPIYPSPSGFLQLRHKLGAETIQENAPEIQDLADSPYFFVRTALTILLTQLKTAAGASLEHAANNIVVLLPIMWPKLRSKDRWQTGEAYAMVHAENRVLAALGLRRALMKVKGFDFVPETLRSETYRKAARMVVNAHVSLNNFYHEREPMEALARLGSSVPGPALANCLSAALCARLGNRYGFARDAQETAIQFLKSFGKSQWEQYINELLLSDRIILDKLASEDLPLTRWIELTADLKLHELEIHPRVSHIVATDASRSNRMRVQSTAQKLRINLMREA